MKKLDKNPTPSPDREQSADEQPKYTFDFAKAGKTLVKAKLQCARKLLLERMGGKSGANAFQKFEYFELKDFLPHIINIFEELHLEDSFHFCEGDLSYLTITDLETGEYIRASTCPTPNRAKGNPNQQMQSIGALQTYTRRYLYMSALNIVENDIIDAKSGEHKLSVDEVNKHMQEVLNNPRDWNEAKKELNQLKIENKITQKVYEAVYHNIEKAGGK